MTEPLSEDFTTDGDKLIRFADEVFRFESDDSLRLEEWQRWLIRRVLETYPSDWEDESLRGKLRYRQVVISLGRQNGKSVLGAVFALYGLILMKKRGARVISLASDKDQANIIFGKVRFTVENHPLLKRRFKSTRYRGIYSNDKAKPANYVVKAGRGEGLQGAGVNMCVFDEVHISREDAWDAMVFGMSAEANAILIGITTAGDDNSDLLKRLYKQGKESVSKEENHNPRFGFFLWEAPEHLDMYDPEAIKAANPAIAAGRIPVEQEIQNMRGMPEHEAKRYRLNQFVSSENVWLSLSKWAACSGNGIDKKERLRDVVFAIDKTPHWDYVSIVAAVRDKNGIIQTEMVSQLTNSNLDEVYRECMRLAKKFRDAKFYMDTDNLRELSNKLRENHVPTEYLTTAQIKAATVTAYSVVTERRLIHNNDPIITAQLPRAVTENSGEGYKVSRKKSSGDIDSIMATIIAIYGAETQITNGPMLYVPK